MLCEGPNRPRLGSSDSRIGAGAAKGREYVVKATIGRWAVGRKGAETVGGKG